MAAPAMDAVGSFTHLIEKIPSWITQLEGLSQYTKDKNAEFVAEYARLVKSVRPKRVKSPSVCSIHSSEKSVHLPNIESAKATEPAEACEVDPLEAGTRHIYAEQVQRKRKPNASLRSGASGPQRFRTKHQVVIYYDAHVQEEFDTMVKSAGVARNNLRKGKNALVAGRGFRLPALSKRYDTLTSPSLENVRSLSKYRTSSMSPTGSKGNFRTATAQPQDDDDLAFINSDKVLEQVQALYETAAHQFLRDGDCQKELQGATTKLKELLNTATTVAETLKVKQQKAAVQAAADASDAVSCNQIDATCPSLLTEKSTMEPTSLPSVPVKGQMSALHQTLEDMRSKGVVSAPPVTAPAVPQGPMTIEVDDGSDTGSFDEIDISQFRSANRLRMRG